MASKITENRNPAQSADGSAFEIVKNGVESIEIGAEDVSDPQDGKSLSKKAAKKEAAKAERLQKRQMAAAAAAATVVEESDPLAGNYGDLPLEAVQSKEISGRKWTRVGSLMDELKDQQVLVRGRAHAIRGVSSKMAFLVVREAGYTVQCVLNVNPGVVSKGMVKFVTGLSKESIVDVEGIVTVPNIAITGASQQVEIHVRKVYCVSKSQPTLPINLEDAARSEKEFEKAEQTGEHVVRAVFALCPRLFQRSNGNLGRSSGQIIHRHSRFRLPGHRIELTVSRGRSRAFERIR